MLLRTNTHAERRRLTRPTWPVPKVLRLPLQRRNLFPTKQITCYLSCNTRLLSLSFLLFIHRICYCCCCFFSCSHYRRSSLFKNYLLSSSLSLSFHLRRRRPCYCWATPCTIKYTEPIARKETGSIRYVIFCPFVWLFSMPLRKPFSDC